MNRRWRKPTTKRRMKLVVKEKERDRSRGKEGEKDSERK
jgi:hypothetical protein